MPLTQTQDTSEVSQTPHLGRVVLHNVVVQRRRVRGPASKTCPFARVVESLRRLVAMVIPLLIPTAAPGRKCSCCASELLTQQMQQSVRRWRRRGEWRGRSRTATSDKWSVNQTYPITPLPEVIAGSPGEVGQHEDRRPPVGLRKLHRRECDRHVQRCSKERNALITREWQSRLRSMSHVAVATSRAAAATQQSSECGSQVRRRRTTCQHGGGFQGKPKTAMPKPAAKWASSMSTPSALTDRWLRRTLQKSLKEIERGEKQKCSPMMSTSAPFSARALKNSGCLHGSRPGFQCGRQ